MINKIAIAALGVAVLGLGTSHGGLSQPLAPPAAQAVDELTGIEIITAGSPTDFTFLSGMGRVTSFATHTGPGALPPVSTPAPTVSVPWVGGFGGGFSPVAPAAQTTSIPTGSSFPNLLPPNYAGAAGSASISAGNPFTPPLGTAFVPLDMDAVATVQDCCGAASAGKEFVFSFSVTPTGGDTMQLSLTQSIALIAEGTISPLVNAFASVGSHFEVDGPGGPLWTMNSFDSLSNPGCGVICSTTSTQPVTSGMLALSAPGNYKILIDPLAQAEVVFEPSSMLLLGSGLAGLGFAARRRKIRN